VTLKIIASLKDLPFDQHWINTCAEAAKSVDVQAIIAAGFTGNHLAAKLKEKRQEKIDELLSGLL
jgi:hypothetical protein